MTDSANAFANWGGTALPIISYTLPLDPKNSKSLSKDCNNPASLGVIDLACFGS